MKRTPAPSARLQIYSKMLAVVVALLMLSMLPPGAALHAFSASTEKVLQDAGSRRCAVHALCAPTKPAHAHTLMALPDTVTPTYCNTLHKMLGYYSNINDWQKLYDSSKRMVEVCPNDPNVIHALDYASTAALRLLGRDTSIESEYRNWLCSILYLNTTNPEYFCTAVQQLSRTYASVTDTTETLHWKQQNRALAILRWLWTNDTSCHTSALKATYNSVRYSQREDWLNDTTIEYDTTLPSMAELGLDTLLAKHSLYQNENHNSVRSNGLSILSAVGTSPNPTSNGTILTFSMSQAAYVKVEVYDLLGNAVRAGGFEQHLGAGNHSVPIDLAALASGTYYARLITAYGETRTVKIGRE